MDSSLCITHWANQELGVESFQEYKSLWIFHFGSSLSTLVTEKKHYILMLLHAQIKLSKERLSNFTYLKSSLAKSSSCSYGKQECSYKRTESIIFDKISGIWCTLGAVSILITYGNLSWLGSSLIQNKNPIQKINYRSVVLRSLAQFS